MLRTSNRPSAFNKLLVCAKRYVPHTRSVYTIFVHTGLVITRAVRTEYLRLP